MKYVGKLIKTLGYMSTQVFVDFQGPGSYEVFTVENKT